MIQTVFFDLGWTLVKPRSGDWTFTECFFSAFPQIRLSDLRSEPLKGMISTAFAPLRENPYMRSVSEQIRRYEIFFRTFCSLAGLPYSDELIRKLAEDISLNDRNMVPVATALETLRYLKENGYVIGVISDTWPNIETQLDALGMTPYFDTLTYSYRLGTNKPSPMMFQDALEKTGTDPRKCVLSTIFRQIWKRRRNSASVLSSLWRTRTGKATSVSRRSGSLRI